MLTQASALHTMVTAMEKLVYALWSDVPDRENLCRELVGPVADGLRAAGARGVQVNVDDAAVANARIRPSTFDQPIAAVVCLWVDSAAGPAAADMEQVLRAVSTRLIGYLVTESVPVPMPGPDGPGGRSPGFTNIAFLRRPAEMGFEQWRSRWQDQHTQVAIDVQGTCGYVQNLVVRALTPDAPEYAAIVEEQFPDAAATDMLAFYGVDPAMADPKAELRRRVAVMMESVGAFGADQGITVVPSSRYELGGPSHAQS